MERLVSGKTAQIAPLGRVVSFATITAAGFVLGRMSGLVREMVVSAHFGLSGELDAYFLASLVPTLINNIVAGSAITAAVMPTFGRYVAAGQRDEFWRAASAVTNVILLITGGLTLLGMLAAVPIIALLGADLAASTRSLAAALLVIMMPTLVLGAALNMLMAMLNSTDRFLGPSLIFLALNVGIIGTVVLLSPIIGIYSVAWGFLIGVALQVAVQVVELRLEKPRYTWRIDWRHPALRETLVAFLPITALSVVAQINLVIDRSMATALPPGSISALYYADSILGSFYMLGISLGIAVFPSLSRLAATNDMATTARTIIAALRLLIFVLAPLTGLAISFAAPIIGLVLGRGKFDAVAVHMTGQAMSMYAIGLVAIAALYVLQRAFFAQSDSVTPFVVGLLTAFVHVGLNLILMHFLAHAGIALSTSLTAIIAVVALVLLLRRRIPSMDLWNLLGFAGECGLMALVSTGFVAWLFASTQLGDQTTFAWIVGVALAVLGGLIYLGMAAAAQVPECRLLLQTARALLRRNST
jgi:putative peptidoglycan lipid II flippase